MEKAPSQRFEALEQAAIDLEVGQQRIEENLEDLRSQMLKISDMLERMMKNQNGDDRNKETPPTDRTATPHIERNGDAGLPPTTVRVDDSKNTEHLTTLNGAKERFQLIKANLLEESSFDAVVDGCDGVFHVTSPFYNAVTDLQTGLIDPALKVAFNCKPRTPEVDDMLIDIYKLCDEELETSKDIHMFNEKPGCDSMQINKHCELKFKNPRGLVIILGDLIISPYFSVIKTKTTKVRQNVCGHLIFDRGKYLLTELVKNLSRIVSSSQSAKPKHTTLISLSGHLFDQFLINEALDIIEAVGGSFNLVKGQVGQSTEAMSYSVLQVGANDKEVLDKITDALSSLANPNDGRVDNKNNMVSFKVGRIKEIKIEKESENNMEVVVLILGDGCVCGPAVEFLTTVGHSPSRQWLNSSMADDSNENTYVHVIAASLFLKDTEEIIEGIPNATTVQLDVAEEENLCNYISQVEVAINLMPPSFHSVLAKACIQLQKHLVTASYVEDSISKFDELSKTSGRIRHALCQSSSNSLCRVRMLNGAVASSSISVFVAAVVVNDQVFFLSDKGKGVVSLENYMLVITRQKWTDITYTSPTRSSLCDTKPSPLSYLKNEHICGRPLGLRFDKRTGDLYIVEAYFGLMKAGPDGGLAALLTNEAEGVPLRFTNDLGIDA